MGSSLHGNDERAAPSASSHRHPGLEPGSNAKPGAAPDNGTQRPRHLGCRIKSGMTAGESAPAPQLPPSCRARPGIHCGAHPAAAAHAARWTPGRARGDAAYGAGHLHPTGFTLIELLVGLALLGLAASLVLSVVQAAGLIAHRAQTGSAALDDSVGAQRALRTVVERLCPVTRTDSALPIVDLRGTADELAFVAPPPAADAPDALQRYRLTRTAAGALTLWRASTRAEGLDPRGQDLRGWRGTALLEGVAGLSIDYLGATDRDPHQAWRTRWWDQPRTPELIRIRLRFVPGDPRPWPALVIRPRATINGACPVDPLTGACAERRDL